jgi:hypothetical protein
MLTGKWFRLKRNTISIQTQGDQRHVVVVPEGAIVHVLSGPRPDDKRMVKVSWEAKMLVMFAEDIQARGQEVETDSRDS